MTTFFSSRARREAAAFTLIELLVSMTVLTLLVLAVSQIVSGTTRISSANRQHLDADAQARLVFDRMALDFGRMLKRRDVDYIFSTQQSTSDDKFFFYTEAPAFFYTESGSASIPATAQSPLSLVGYRISTSQKYPYQLSRLGRGLEWDESNASSQNATEPVSIAFLTPLSPLSTNSTPAQTPYLVTTLPGRFPKTLGTAPEYISDDSDPAAAASYHILADGVCRMEICFLLKPRPATSTTAAQPAKYSFDPFYKVDATGATDYAHNAVNGLQDVEAIVVGLVVLDHNSRQTVTDFSKMKTAFPDLVADDLATTPPTLMAKKWQAEIDAHKVAADAQIPQTAAAQVRVYQRHFYLDTH